jgi:aryl-alcohol dehydrogenase-like predicted oxidoreductase
VTSPIIGPRAVEQLRDNMGAMNITLSAEELKAVDALNPPGELCRDRHLGAVPR